ncbi:MAG: CvpA family protein [Eubacteriaceae bacterium]|jgi:uncharacterized membrane protein required for colicin V production|nr:CvpA family protein [Bacilli bacterium]MDD4507486.1 CvpA family protein [Eubacteriaceae bacterium]
MMTIHGIDIICFAVIVITAIAGFKKGAIGTIIGLVGLIASFILAWVLTPLIYEWLMGNTSINTVLTQSVLKWVIAHPSMVQWLSLGSTQLISVNSFLTQIGATGMDVSTLMSGSLAGQVESLLMPVVKKIVEALLFLLMFIVFTVIIKVVKHATEKINKVPVFGSVNRLVGTLIGAVKGIVLDFAVVWILYFICVLIGNTTWVNSLSSGVISSVILSIL